MSRNGTFISIEGLDGAGKTTLINALDEQFDVVTTSEPSEFWTGEQLRKALSSETPEFTDFFLFMADRHYHIESLIKPNIEAGKTVISDRFADSTRVYQPYQLGDSRLEFPAHWIESVMAPWNYPPDIVLYLRIDVDTALERADSDEKYENRDMLEQVKENYESLVCSQIESDTGPEYIVLDGEKPKSDIVQTAKLHLENKI